MKHKWGDMAMLRAAAESLTDAIGMRVSMENRVLRGGAAADSEAAQRLTGIARASENDCRALLFSLYTEAVPGPVREWAAGIPGLATGEVFPRLIGLIGNPLTATPYKWEIPAKGARYLIADGEPYDRSVRQLWAWCGCGDPARRIEAGMSQEQLLACGKRTVIRPLLYTFSSYIARSGRTVTKDTSAKFGLPVSQAVAGSRYFKIFSEAKEQGLTKVHAMICRNRKRPPATASWSVGMAFGHTPAAAAPSPTPGGESRARRGGRVTPRHTPTASSPSRCSPTCGSSREVRHRSGSWTRPAVPGSPSARRKPRWIRPIVLTHAIELTAPRGETEASSRTGPNGARKPGELRRPFQHLRAPDADPAVGIPQNMTRAHRNAAPGAVRYRRGVAGRLTAARAAAEFAKARCPRQILTLPSPGSPAASPCAPPCAQGSAAPARPSARAAG